MKRGLKILILILVLFITNKAKIVGAVDSTNYGQTPLEEAVNYPRPAGERLQLMTYLIFNKQGYDSYKSYLASKMDFLWLDQSSLSQVNADDSYVFTNFYAAINELHNLNSSLNVGTHGGMAGMVGPFHLIYSYLAESDFLHTANGERINNSGDPRLYYVNLGNSTTVQKLKDGWADIMTNKAPQLTGINFDGYHSYHLEPKFTNSCIEGACNTKDYWYNNQKNLSQTLNASLATEKLVTYNGIIDFWPTNDPHLYGLMNSEPLAYHDGVLVEHPHTMILNQAEFEDYMNVFDNLIKQQKKIFFWVQPQILTLQHPTFQFSNDLNLERFYLATYLLIQNNPHTYFGYHPGAIYNGNNGVYFYKDWVLNYGTPTDHFSINNGLYVREYTNGLVVVNPTVNAVNFNLPNGDYKKWQEINVAGTQNIASKSGVFFFKNNCLSEDVNMDGIVDASDYTLLVTDFFSTTPSNAKADINKDEIVDIVDYSLLVKKYFQDSVCEN